MKRDKGDFRLRKEISQRRFILSAILTFIIIFAGWWALCASGNVRELFLPSPIKVIGDIAAGAKNGSLWVNMGYSIFRITMGFLLSVAIGVPLGILAGSFKPLEAIIAPICEFIRYMPVPAFVPLVMVWCGIGEAAKITIVFLGCFFQLVLMIADDARSVSDDRCGAGGIKLGAWIFHIKGTEIFTYGKYFFRYSCDRDFRTDYRPFICIRNQKNVPMG